MFRLSRSNVWSASGNLGHFPSIPKTGASQPDTSLRENSPGDRRFMRALEVASRPAGGRAGFAIHYCGAHPLTAGVQVSLIYAGAPSLSVLWAKVGFHGCLDFGILVGLGLAPDLKPLYQRAPQ